jgi:adenylyltransferase/sulfurtransferase
VVIFAQRKGEIAIDVPTMAYCPIEHMKQLSPDELRDWMAQGKAFKLIDVREAFEHEAFNIGGELIPIGSIMASQARLDRDAPIVMYCEKGIRSVIAIQRLEALGFDNLYNLAGGMKAWKARLSHL